MRRGLLVGLGVMTLAACAGGGTHLPVMAEPEPLRLPDMYSGAIEIEGDPFPSTLLIYQAGATLTSRMTASAMGMTADGSGTVDGSDVVLTMAYGEGCVGTARLVGQVAERTLLYTGRIIASDCTGDVVGSFRFTPDQSR